MWWLVHIRIVLFFFWEIIIIIIADHKEIMEAENKKTILNFGSLLNESLKDLQKTITVSVSQQQKQLKSMEDHVSFYLASKSNVSQTKKSCFSYKLCLSHVQQ